ncbi:MAG: tyrosine recombinase [Pyrinomonadaceae bacterium]
MTQLIDNYIRHLRTERGLAEQTIEAYRRDLDKLVAWCLDAELDAVSLSRSDLSEFVMTLRYAGLSPASIDRIVAGVRGFYKFLVREGVLRHDPTEFLQMPEKERYIPRFLNRDEVVQLIEAAETPEERAVLDLLYATGIRVSELCGLSVSDLHDGYIKVAGKGSKERLVPCGREALSSVRSYLAAVHLGPPPPDVRLFDLSRGDVWRLVRRVAARAGLEGVSPHTLRHTCATHLMQSGRIDIRFVQQMLGHASVSTTQVYTHVTSDALKENYMRFHPRAGGSRPRPAV